MELLLLVRAVWLRWWLVLLPIVVVGALTLPDLLARPTGGGGYSITIDYSAAQSYDAIPREQGDYQDIWISSEYTVNALTDWIRGTRFREEVAAYAAAQGVEVPAGAPGISADNEKSIGRISFGWSNAAELELLADGVIDVLQNRSAAYFAQLGGEPAAVTILSRSPATPAPPPLADRFGSVLRIGLGAALGIGLALLAYYLDPAVRRREDLEALGVPVIAAIPK